MFIFEQMGHKQISDAECVSWLAFGLVRWGKKLALRSLLRQRLDETFESESFRAELRLIPDYEKDDGTLCVEVRLRRRGPGRHRDRFVYLRREHAWKRLHHPRTWRKVGGLNRNRRQGRHRKLLFLDLARDLYFGARTALDDIRAQLTIALVQLCLISRDSDACLWLLEYLRGFRIRADGSLTKAEREQNREATALLVRATLIDRWSFPEDYRAFRKYVGRTIKRVLREYIGPTNIHTGFVAKEPSFVPAHAKHTLAEKLFRANASVGRPPSLSREDTLKVQEAAHYLGCSESYVYRIIRQCAVRTVSDAEPILVPRSELDRVRGILGERLARRGKRKELELSGKTPDAARKAVFRKYGPSPNIITTEAKERGKVH